MNNNRPTGNANSPKVPGGQLANQAARPAQSCYVTSAALVDVLYDQLEYLVAHTGRDCPSDCLECGRLERVKHWLLLPFRKSSAMA
jgi:hypothetical protein